MADIGVAYTLTTPGPDIVFNQYTDPFARQNQYFLNEIRGLEAPAIRTPQDPVPLGDGALVHPFYYGGTHITFEGIIIADDSTIDTDNEIVVARNTMTANLKSALNSILRADGTLTWTPQGGSLQTISGLRYEIPLETPHTPDYRFLSFSFGLVTPTPYS